MNTEDKQKLSEDEQDALSRAFAQYQQEDENTFIEVIIRQKKKPLDFLKIAGAILLYIVLLFVSLMFDFMLFLMPFIIVGGAALVWWVVTSTSREFEYIVTRGDLDVDQITAQRKRKRIYSVKAKELEMMAAVRSDEYRSFQNQTLKVLDLSTNDKSEDNWFIVSKYGDSRVMALIDPSEKVIRAIHRYAPSKVRYNRAVGVRSQGK